METSGIDPEITICKIAVLPIKLCPLIVLHKLNQRLMKLLAIPDHLISYIYIFIYIRIIYIDMNNIKKK